MLSITDREAKITLLGAVLIKFATGLATIWTNSNIYFVSQLKHKGYHPTQNTYSIIFLSALIPASFAVLISMPLSKYFGYKKVVRSSAFIFLLSPLALNFIFTPGTFAIFWLMLPLSCFCIGATPILNCLWTHFPRNLSTATALVIVSFSLGTIFWNLLFMYIVNPNNEKAEIDDNNIPIFSQRICSSLLFASNICYLTAGTLYIIGSFLITKKDNIEQPQGIITQSSGDINNINLQRAVQMLSDSDARKSNKLVTLLQGLKDKKFMIIFMISSTVPIYLIYLTLNIKLLYMPIINDDHFLSYCSVIVTLSALIGAPFWGYICDIKGFQLTLAILIFIDTIIKIFGIYCTSKWSLAVLFLCLGINDKGLVTIVGPGLVSMFGIDLATDLIPYKGLAILLCYFMAPIMHIFLFERLQLSLMLAVMTFFSGIGIILSLYLKFKVRYRCKAALEECELRLMNSTALKTEMKD